MKHRKCTSPLEENVSVPDSGEKKLDSISGVEQCPEPESSPSVQDNLKNALSRIQGLEGEIARTLREMQEKVHQLECLMSFSSLLNSTLDPASVREKALEATCKLLGCETASLFLVDPKTGELYWETALGRAGQELKKTFRLPVDDRSIAGYVALTGESVIINDVEQDPRHFKKSDENVSFRTKTMVCVPLRARDQNIGVLQALNKLPSISQRTSEHSWPDFHEDDLRLLETLGHQVSVAVENSKLYTDLKNSFYDTVEALAEAIEKKDRYTGGHTKRVVRYTMCITKYLSLTPDEVERIRLGALLHDVGKIGIEDSILKKQSSLTEDEWETMKKHPELGYDIMGRVEGLRDVVCAMRYHHERWDGKGYPLGLSGEEIPLLARIIAVADTYDAMVSCRPYRKGTSPRAAYEEIVKYRGTQFDPQVVDAFMQAFDKENMAKDSGSSRSLVDSN